MDSFILSTLGRAPKPDDMIEHQNYKIKIEKLQADNFQRLQFDARSTRGHQNFGSRRFERPQRSHERPSYRPAQFGRA